MICIKRKQGLPKKMLAKKRYTILGVDPGTRILGYALIEVANNQLHFKESNVLDLTKVEAERKLGFIMNELRQIMLKHKPDAMGIEAPFFGKNPQSMLQLGRVQGVAMGLATLLGIEVQEYAPRSIKQSITGNGNASKEQVMQMVKHVFKLEKNKQQILYDETDALAIAYCYAQHIHHQAHPIPELVGIKKQSTKKKGRNAWSQFIKIQKQPNKNL